jgi:predicted MPP superfamily phosphohydrolase
LRLFLFLFIFSILYGGLHFYAFMKARAAWAFSGGTGLALAIYMLIMVFSPVLVRVSENAGLEVTARILSFFGYVWMGILFLFVSAGLLLDFWRAVVYLAGTLLGTDLSALSVSPMTSFFVPFFLSLFVAAYGYGEALRIRVEKVVVRTPKIPENVGTLRIAQISDVHLGLMVRGKRLQRILDKVEALHPDLLVSTGDLVDGQIDNLSEPADMLREVQARFGKFAIIGNHEVYAGLKRSIALTEKAGFSVLRGKAVLVPGLVSIAGVDDVAAERDGLVGIPERSLLAQLPRDTFILFLKHRPLVDEETLGLFDLQLSGHVHKGQVFPFTLVTRLFYPYDAGFFSLAHRSRLYVSRGSGTWGPPIRFLSPPEVTLIELVHENENPLSEESRHDGHVDPF